MARRQTWSVEEGSSSLITPHTITPSQAHTSHIMYYHTYLRTPHTSSHTTYIVSSHHTYHIITHHTYTHPPPHHPLLEKHVHDILVAPDTPSHLTPLPPTPPHISHFYLPHLHTSHTSTSHTSTHLTPPPPTPPPSHTSTSHTSTHLTSPPPHLHHLTPSHFHSPPTPDPLCQEHPQHQSGQTDRSAPITAPSHR